MLKMSREKPTVDIKRKGEVNPGYDGPLTPSKTDFSIDVKNQNGQFIPVRTLHWLLVIIKCILEVVC